MCGSEQMASEEAGLFEPRGGGLMARRTVQQIAVELEDMGQAGRQVEEPVEGDDGRDQVGRIDVQAAHGLAHLDPEGADADCGLIGKIHRGRFSEARTPLVPGPHNHSRATEAIPQRGESVVTSRT